MELNINNKVTKKKAFLAGSKINLKISISIPWEFLRATHTQGK